MSQTPPPGDDDHPYLEWEEAPATVADDSPARSRAETPPHNLTALAGVSACSDPALVYNEGIEEAIRAMYVVMRRQRLTQSEMDAIVLAVRGELTHL